MKDTTTQTSSASSLTSLSANPRRRLAVRTANGVARRPLEPVNGAPKKNEFRLEEKLVEAFSEETPPVNILKEPAALATFRTLNCNSPDFIDKVLLCIETVIMPLTHSATRCILYGMSYSTPESSDFSLTIRSTSAITSSPKMHVIRCLSSCFSASSGSFRSFFLGAS